MSTGFENENVYALRVARMLESCKPNFGSCVNGMAAFEFSGGPGR